MTESPPPRGKADLSSLHIDDSERTEARRARPWIWILVVLFMTVALVAAVLAFSGGKPEVELAEARAVSSGADGAVILQASGYVTPRRRATVAAKITGRVEEMLVEEGMEVAEGQVLARLDDREARARLASARAEHKVALAALKEAEVLEADARRTYMRLTGLRGDGVVSDEDIDAAQAASEASAASLLTNRQRIESAEANIQMALRDLENCTVRAPFAGIAVSKDAQVGEMVSPVSAGGGFTRTGISTVVDMESLEIEVDVNEAYIAKVNPGQKASAVLDAYPDWRIPCSVRTVIPTADRQKATVKVRISFDGLDPRILPDMGVKVSFIQQEDDSGARPAARALVPKSAVRNDGGAKILYVYQDGRLSRRAVSVGSILSGEIEILAGVSAGERVVVSGTDGLEDGRRVSVSAAGQS